MHLAELTGTAGLLFVTVHSLSGLCDSLTIRDLRSIVLNFDLVELLNHPLHDVEVLLALTGDDELFQFLGLLHLEGRVSLADFVERSAQFLIVSAVLGADGGAELGFRINGGFDHVIALGHEGGTSGRRFQFDGSHDVTGHSLLDLHAVLAAESEQLGDTLLSVGGGVHHIVSFLDFAVGNLDESDFAEVLFDTDLEDIACERLGGVALVLVTVGGLHSATLVGSRAVLDDKVHEAVNALVGLGGHADHRECAAVSDTELQTTDHLVFGEGTLFEILVHQSLIVLSSCLNQSCVHFLSLVHLVGGNVFHHHLSTVGREFEHLHLQKVDHSVEAEARVDGILESHDAAAEVFLQLMQGLVKVGFLVVELVDGEHHGDVGGLGVAPLDFSTHIDTVLGVDDHEGGVHHAEGGNGLTNEVIEARTVHHVDFGAVEFGIHDGALD